MSFCCGPKCWLQNELSRARHSRRGHGSSSWLPLQQGEEGSKAEKGWGQGGCGVEGRVRGLWPLVMRTLNTGNNNNSTTTTRGYFVRGHAVCQGHRDVLHLL